jgi:hypothetical protein
LSNNRYTVEGYLNAVLRRSSSTLLVEGKTDKLAIIRIISELKAGNFDGVVIDTVEIIKDGELEGLGSRVKLEKIKNKVALKSHLNFPLVTLVDREWNGLLDDQGSLVHAWVSPPQTENDFQTVGHSIENYYFVEECILQYLTFAFAEQTTALRQEIIRNQFQSILALAASFSEAALKANIISRCGSIMNPSHLRVEDGNWALDGSIIVELERREIDDAQGFIEAVNFGANGIWSNTSRSDFCRWFLHGHLGENVLWSAIGKIFQNDGLPEADANKISNGYMLERSRFWHDWLSKTTPANRAPLDDAINLLFAKSAK